MPQQNAFGRPFSLKKHEEMFCDFAKTSSFFNERSHTKCISLYFAQENTLSTQNGISYQVRRMAYYIKYVEWHIRPRTLDGILYQVHRMAYYVKFIEWHIISGTSNGVLCQVHRMKRFVCTRQKRGQPLHVGPFFT